jgi:histone-lysine N-methyltransferase SETMAR
MKDVLLLHDSVQPHTSFRTHEAIAKLGWSVFPDPAHSPNVATSDYHLFGPVNDAPCGHHFADDNKLKRSFHGVL